MAEPAFRVWDVGVRWFHWLLVLAVGTALVTGFLLAIPTLRWHLVAGCTVAALLLWRCIWGTLGGPYSRFAGFAYRPGSVLAYARGLLAGRHERYLGHNPLGAMMVFALLLVLTAIVLTGAITLGGMLKQGPLRAVLSFAAGRTSLQVHKLLGFLLLAMIAGHLAGVVFESLRERENLARAMLTGRKRWGDVVGPRRPAHAVPALAVAIAVAGGLGGAAGIAALAALPARGVPPPTVDPVYAEQCGGCHLAFPPSLAPAATWNTVLDHMDSHFGENPGLPPDMIAHFRAYLDANDASHWDTLPAHVLRIPAPGGSLRITDTPGWKRIHRAIPSATFTSPPVYHRSHCEACHGDAATGRFAPQLIAVPLPHVRPS
ncbi:MAG TPA: cytochrome b/b6 domain-containing protein [Acidisphaera sp.]|nr:cytochrome b/b6 domain-containing protein [Acidisphaera sp.]